MTDRRNISRATFYLVTTAALAVLNAFDGDFLQGVLFLSLGLFLAAGEMEE